MNAYKAIGTLDLTKPEDWLLATNQFLLYKTLLSSANLNGHRNPRDLLFSAIYNGVGPAVTIYSRFITDHAITLRKDSPVNIVDKESFDYSIGQEVDFKLIANPTVKREGKRHALTTYDKAYEWLARKFKDAASILKLSMVPYPLEAKIKKTKRNNIFKVFYFGRLKVENPEILKGMYYAGIGPAKAFGCGMLILQ